MSGTSPSRSSGTGPRRGCGWHQFYVAVCPRCGEENPEWVALEGDRDHYRDEFMRLRDWLMGSVGVASTLGSAKRVVERAIHDAMRRS